MSDDLYQARLLDAARKGRGAGRLAEADGRSEVDNPLCGDRVRLDVRVRDGVVRAIGHEVRGCLLCEAAATLIAEHAEGVAVDALAGLGDDVRCMLDGNASPPPGWEALEMFAPVAARPSRHDCVLLPFEALRQALAAIPPGGADTVDGTSR